MTDWLDRLVGEWTYEGGACPDDPARRHSGRETVTRHGVWLIIESDDHARFQLTFDKDRGRFTGDFISWEHPGLWVYDGAAPDGDSLVLTSRGPRLDGAPGETDYEDHWDILSPDERLTTGRYRDDDGVWRDFNWTRYRRKV